MVIIVPWGSHSLVHLAHGRYYAAHFEDVLIHGVGQCPTLGWGLWPALCALGKPSPSLGHYAKAGGTPAALWDALCRQGPSVLGGWPRGVLMPAPDSCCLQLGPHPVPQRWGTWASGAGGRGKGLTVLCLCLLHPGQRVLRKLPPGSPGAPCKYGGVSCPRGRC